MTIELTTGPVANGREPLSAAAKGAPSKKPALKNPPILAFFSDFDGTITESVFLYKSHSNVLC